MWRSLTFRVLALAVTVYSDDIDISCGHRAVGSVTAITGSSITFRFSNDRRQEISLHDVHHSFTPNTMIHEINGRFQMNSTATNCDEGECDGQYFQFMALTHGKYMVEMEMAPDVIGDNFEVDLMCGDVHDLLVEEVSMQRSLLQISTTDIECQEIWDAYPYDGGAWCPYSIENNDYLMWMYCWDKHNYGTVQGITLKDIEQFGTLYEVTNDLGIGLNNNFVLFALLCVNVVTITLVTWGINLSEVNTDKQRRISSLLSIIAMILSTTFLSVNPPMLAGCIWGGTIPSIFHVGAFALSTIVCTQWAHYCCSSRRVKFKYFVFVFIFIVPFLIYMHDAWTVRTISIILWFVFELLFLLKLCQLRPGVIKTCSCLQRCDNLFPCCHCNWYHRSWFILLFAIITQAGFCALAYPLRIDNVCIIFSFSLLFSPFCLFSLIVLWRANLRALCALHIVTMLPSAGFGLFFYGSESFCVASNVQYIVYTLCAPLMIFLVFKANSEFIPDEWTRSLVGIFLVSFDVLTSLFVIYAFIESCDYMFAVLQFLCIIAGQVAGAVLDIVTGDDIHKMTKMDKIMGIFGFSHIWYVVNWWAESTQTEAISALKYQMLKDKHKIWDLMFDTFPSMALQIYAAMSSDSDVAISTLTISILFSLASVSFTVIRYMLKLLTVANGPKVSGSVENPTSKSTVVSKIKNAKPGKAPMIIFGFVVSDFLVRSVPLIAFLASLGSMLDDAVTDTVRWILNFVIISSFVVAEYFANRWMRNGDDKDSRFVLKTFGASLFSSFYNLLCALTAFKDDNLFSKKVDFSKFAKEHWMRSILSVILSIIAVILAVINLTVNDHDDRNDINSNNKCNGPGDSITGSIMLFVFIFCFFIAFWINKWTMKWIQISFIDGTKTPESVAGDGAASTLHETVASKSEMTPMDAPIQSDDTTLRDDGTTHQSTINQSEPHDSPIMVDLESIPNEPEDPLSDNQVS